MTIIKIRTTTFVCLTALSVGGLASAAPVIKDFSSTGVNPGPKWYRPDPNKTIYTITAVLDGKTVTGDELKK
ncbi:MAG: hypothetical protein SVV80_13040 [Planctomycetota bacterium]|nr:hypothetical protein [Planctomycetota bacterium]